MLIDDTNPAAPVIVITHEADDNHLRSADLVRFAALLDELATRDGVVALVITGEGRHFCNGRIGAAGLAAAAAFKADLDLILAVNRRLNSFPVPVIAAIEGHALGFGCGFATQCDLTFAADDAVFALPEMSHGLPPLIVLSYFDKFVPRKRAFELALTSRRFGAREACEIGIVTELVVPGAALARAQEMAASIAQMDQAAVRLLRSFCRHTAGLDDDFLARSGVDAMSIYLAARRPS